MAGDRTWDPVVLGDGHPPPRGAYSPGARAGDLLFVSGQVPRDPRTGETVGADVAAQAERTLENVRLVLQAGGATLDDVVSVTVWLQDVADWAAFDEVYRRTFRPPYPTRAVVGADLRGVRCEIACVARVPDRAGPKPGTRD